MAFDLYQPCPCHQHRKLKFCCGKDVVAQIAKTVELLEGEQRIKAMEHLDKSLQQYGYRDCLTMMRFGSALENKDYPTATRIKEGYEAENGINSIGRSMRMVLCLETDRDTSAAIEAMQDALESTPPDQTHSTLMCDALMSLALHLHVEKQHVAARDHMGLHIALFGQTDQRGHTILESMMASMSTHLVLKQDWPLLPIPEGFPWSKAAAQAVHWAGQGRWRQALKVLQPLADANPDDHGLWKNCAILATRLNYVEQSLVAWRRFAACSKTSRDHAIEAELLVFLLGNAADDDHISTTEVTCEIEDFSALVGHLRQEPLIAEFGLSENPSEPIQENADRLFFSLVDKPVSQDAAQVQTLENTQYRLAALTITHSTPDQPAMLKLVAGKTAAINNAVDPFLDSLPYLRKESITEEFNASVPKMIWDFNFEWLVSANLNASDSSDLFEKLWPEFLCKTFPEYQPKWLEGNRVAQAVKIPHLCRRVEAFLLLLKSRTECSFDSAPGVDAVREVLGLPPEGKINPKTMRLEEMSLFQFARLDFSQMPNPMLAWAFDAASKVSNRFALQAIYAEVRDRLAKDEVEILSTFPIASLLLILGVTEPHKLRSRKYLEEGRTFLDQLDRLDKGRWLLQACRVAKKQEIFDLFVEFFQEAGQTCLAEPEMRKHFFELCSSLGIDLSQGLSGKASPASSGRIIQATNRLDGAGLESSAAATLAQVTNGGSNLLIENAASGGGGFTDNPSPTAPSKLWLPGME